MTIGINTQDPSPKWAKHLDDLEAQAEVTRAQAAQDPQAHLGALTALGQLYLEAGIAPKALTQFEEGLELAEANEDTVAAARLWGLKALALLKLGNASFAQRAFFRCLNLAKETEQTALIIDTQIHIGELHIMSGQQAKAISRLEQAYGLAMQAGEESRQMLAAGQLGNLFLGMQATDKALEYYATAMTQAEAMGNYRAASAFQVGIGDVLLSEKEYGEAAQQYEMALELADGQQDAMAQLRALNGLLRAQIAAGRTSLALVYGGRVVEIAREIGDEHTEIANINLLVSFLLEQEQMRKVLPYLKRGLEIAQAQEDWSWQLSMLTNLGYAYYESGELDAALDAYKQALRLAEQLQEQAAMAQLQGRVGAVLADMDEPQAAAEAAQRALELAQELGDQSLVGEQQIMQAFLYHDLGDIDRALDFCQQAVATFTATEDAVFAAKAQSLLAELGKAVPS